MEKEKWEEELEDLLASYYHEEIEIAEIILLFINF